jgi:succinoglycan biosynthesis protein ExoV
MKLHFYRSPNGERNFGDELGPWLWRRLLPDAFDDDDRELFVGIGTLLNNKLPRARRTVVFGAGYGYGELPLIDSTWHIYCVRGPFTAQVLNLPPSLGVTDPGVLVGSMDLPAEPRHVAHEFAYMPHWSFACDEWRHVCDQIGFSYIDPRADVDTVLAQIRGTKVLIAEAMHGAIVADALRVPWIPVWNDPAIYHFKWRDWCASLGLPYSPHRIISVWQPGSASANMLGRLRHGARLAGAAARLSFVARTGRRMLSDLTVLQERTLALRNELERLRRDMSRDFSRRADLECSGSLSVS